MTTTLKRTAAACLFTAILASVLLTTGITPRTVAAHAEITEDEARGRARIHAPEAPSNLRVEGAAGRPDIAIRVTWNPGHSHERFGYFWITLATIPLPSHPFEANELHCITRRTARHVVDGTESCIRHNVRSGRSSYSETVSGLTPETTYYVHVTETYLTGGSFVASYGSISTITTTATPETPDPGTPTPPEPEASTCTYKHRIIGIPGTTANAYTGRILISSEEPNATASIRAYQGDNGHPIDVLDSEGSAIGSTTSLAPAHSVKRFQLEGARGWHTVIVEHPTARAMRRASVATQLRGPDVGVNVIYAERIEDCETTSTTAE